jgi:hypothetical protein
MRGLAKQSGLAVSTVINAMTGTISEGTQARLSAVMPMIPRRAPKKKDATKHKPGHFKRYLIRYYNLMRWLDVIEQEPGISKRFPRKPEYNMTRDKAAYVCARLDYQMKYHLLDLFGEHVKNRKVVLADCYQCEKWIERIHAALPGVRVALFKKISERKE